MSIVAGVIFLAISKAIGFAGMVMGWTSEPLTFGVIFMTICIAATGILVLGLHLSTLETKPKYETK